jgi:hypothetical protein
MRFARVLVLVMALAGAVVPAAKALRFTDDSYTIPAGVAGKPYSHPFSGDGGCGPALPYRFTVLNGTLPPGLSLHEDGLLSGTPTQAGRWSFWVQLSDEDPPSASWCIPKKSEREFTVQVGASPAAVGTPYWVSLWAAGDAPQTWSVATGSLPPGLALNSANGVIAGTPEVVGSFPLKVTAVDGKGRSVSVDLTITISRRLAIATTRLPVIRVGRAYHTAVKTTGGVAPVKLTVVSGRFPIGVRFNVNTGALTGKPRKVGIYRVTIVAYDTLGGTATRSFVLTVRRQRA